MQPVLGRLAAGAALCSRAGAERRRDSTEGIAALGDIITQWRQQAQLDADARRLGNAAQTADPLPAVEFSVVDVSFDAVADPQLREYLQTLPTSFALSDEAVDRLRNAAAQVLRDSPAFRDFVASLSAPTAAVRHC